MPAIPTNTNVLLPLSGTTDAQRPVLGGEVIYDEVVPETMPFHQGPGTVTANMQLRVVRSAHTGLLDFYYRILATAAFHQPLNFTVETSADPGLVFTYADFRPDGVGTLAPVSFQLYPKDEVQNGINVQVYRFFFETGMTVGESTRFFFISSNKTHFSPTSSYLTSGINTLYQRCPGPPGV